MLAVSSRFLTAIRNTHAISVAAFLYRPSAPTTPVAAPVVDGTVTIDRDARVFRQGSLEVGFSLDDATTQALVRELPFGGYARIERGIRYADGSIERVQLGYFRVDSIVWNELEGSATLTLSDRMAQIQDEAFMAPWTPDGMHPSDAIVAAVQQVFGSSIAYHVSTTPSTEPVLAGTMYDQDRAAAISDLASSIAAEALFDNHGDFVLRPADLPHSVVWSVDAGSDGSLIAAEETLDRSSVRNGVSVRGQPDPETPPLYGLATHDDPTSPTRWGGPFGKVPLIASSTAVATQAQADAAARSLLNLRLGLSRTLVLDAIPNPALEPDDLIEVVFADGRSEEQTINRTEIGLGVDGALALTTTSQYRPTLQPAEALSHASAVEWVAP